MYNRKDVEDLFDEFFTLDGNDFDDFEIGSNVLSDEFQLNSADQKLLKNITNLTNNNTLGSNAMDFDEPDMSIQLDLLNQNFGNFNDNDINKTKKVI